MVNSSFSQINFDSYIHLRDFSSWNSQLVEKASVLSVTSPSPSHSPSLLMVGNFNFPHIVEVALKSPQIHHFFSASDIKDNSFFTLAVDWLEKKTLPTFQDIKGLQNIQSMKIKKHAHKKDYLDFVETYANKFNLFENFSTLVALVTDELVLNAIFNAPLDIQKKYKYRNRVRSEEFDLEVNEVVDLSIGNCGSYLYLSIKDQFGGLTNDILKSFLTKCLNSLDPIRMGAQGAGVGSYMVLFNSSDILYSIHEGQKTEVLIRLPLSKSRKIFFSHEKSFNFCFKPKNEKGGHHV